MSANQRFVLLLGGMLLLGLALMRVSPAQTTTEHGPRTIVADQFIAQGVGEQRTVMDEEGLEVTGQQGVISIKSSGRFTNISLLPRGGGGEITLQMDGREESVPSLSVLGKNPAQNVTITVTGNGPKITLYSSHKKPRVINP